MPKKVFRFRIVLSLIIVALVAFSAIKFVSYAQKGAGRVPSAVPPPTATETLTDPAALGAPNNGDGKAQPGETLLATVTVTNPGLDATGVFLADNPTNPLSPKGANGTFKIGPAAANYSYAGATGNIQFNIAAAQGVLSNSFLGSPAGTISAFDATSANGGTVSVAADGSFNYTSNPSFTDGSDTFTYTISNGVGPARTGTVTIGLTSRVLFVSPTGAGTTCRASSPCSLATADGLGAISANFDLVYVLSGTYNGAAFSMNLLNQRLVGQGVSYAQALTDAGIVLDARSTTTVIAASTIPVLNNTTGSIVTLAPGSLVEDLSINPSGPNTTAGITGSNILSATATIRDLSVTATNAANAVTLSSNSGGTFNFSNVALTAASGIGLSATGGGTVNATQNNTSTINTITTTTGTALNVANTTIGGSGLTFRSITAGTAASGAPASGIILNNTGASGGLTVSGNGSAGSGGTIQKTTGNAIDMTSTGATSLSLMTIQNSTHLGINGTTLGTFTLANSSVVNNGTVANADDGIKLLDVSGTATFTSDTVTGNHVTNLFFGGITSSAVVTNSLTVTGGTYGSSATNSGIQVGMTGTSKLKTATFTGVTFSSNASTGLQVQSNDNSIVGDGVGAPATGTVTISGCTFTNNAGNTAIDIDQGGGNGAGQMYARIINNLTITGNGGPAINVFDSSSATGGTMKVRIDGNHVGNAGVVGSGTTLGPGIRVFLQGQTTNTVTIVNNVVRQTLGSRGIDVEAPGPTATSKPITISDIVITGNDVDTNDEANPSGSLDAIYVAADDQGSPAEVNAEIHGNTVPSFSNSTPGPTGGCFDWPTFDGHAPWLYYRIATSGGVAKLFDFNGPHANANVAISTTQTAGTAGADISGNGGVQLTGTAVNSIAQLFVPSKFNDSYASTRGYDEPETTDGFRSGSSFLSTSFAETNEFLAPSAELRIGTERVSDLGTKAEIALAEPVVNILGTDIARSEVIAIPRQASTEDKPSLIAELYDKLTSSIEPTVEAQGGTQAPASGTITTTPIFTLPAGSSVTITYQLNVASGPFPAALNNLTDAATVSGSNFSTVTATPAASIPLDANPNISVANTDSSPITQPGAVLIYPVSATNSTYLTNGVINGQDATGVVLTETVPTGTTFNAGLSSAGWMGCADGAAAGTVCTNTIGAVTASGTPVTRNFAVNVPANAGPTLLSVADSASVADDGLNGANQAGAVTSISDTDQVQGIWLGGTSIDWATAANWSNSLLPGTGAIAPANQNVSIPTNAATNSPEIVSADVLLNSVVLGGNKGLTIDSGRTLTINSSISIGANKVIGNPAGTGTLALVSPATISFTNGSGWVQTAMSRNFVGGVVPPPADGAADVNAPDAPDAVFTFPVGTGAGYFPVDVTPTAGSTGSLTIQTFDGTAGVAPPLNAAKTLGRYWTVSGGAGITASMKFSYNATTINGTETNYKPQRVTAGVATSFFDNCPSGTCVDETNNFIFMPAVSNGSFAGNWTASELAPTAAQVAVAGRVLTADGQAIRGVRITLDDGTGHAMTAISNAFGYYRFDEVQSGGTYIMNATARGYTFTPRVMSVNDELTDVTLTALP